MRKPARNYRDVVRNERLFRAARQVAAGLGIGALGFVCLVLYLCMGRG